MVYLKYLSELLVAVCKDSDKIEISVSLQSIRPCMGLVLLDNYVWRKGDPHVAGTKLGQSYSTLWMGRIANK
jgi:hypothetical protein